MAVPPGCVDAAPSPDFLDYQRAPSLDSLKIRSLLSNDILLCILSPFLICLGGLLRLTFVLHSLSCSALRCALKG